MSYRYNKKKKRNHIFYFLGALVFLVVIFTPVTRIVFDFFEKPLAIAFSNTNYLKSVLTQGYQTKKDLYKKIKDLEEKNKKLSIENLKIDYLEDSLGKKVSQKSKDNFISSSILSKSSSDIILVDTGKEEGVTLDVPVLSLNGSLLGYVSSVFGHSSEISLLYKKNNKNQGILFPENLSIDLYGNGNGLVTTLNREIDVSEGDLIFSQNSVGNIIGKVSYVDFDPRDPSKKVFISPIENIQEIQIVNIKK